MKVKEILEMCGASHEQEEDKVVQFPSKLEQRKEREALEDRLRSAQKRHKERGQRKERKLTDPRKDPRLDPFTQKRRATMSDADLARDIAREFRKK